MDKLDYLQLAEQYATFLAAVGGVSITVLTLILNLGSKSEDKALRLTKRNSRVFLITALMVATVTSFVGAHMLVETVSTISSSRAAAKECAGKQTSECVEKISADKSGERLFLLASTNIFIAALLVLFALMLLPMASGEMNAAVTPVSIWVFVLVTAGIILWLIRAAVYRMPPDNAWYAIVPFIIGLVWLFSLFYISRKFLLRLTFIPITGFTVALFGYFAVTFHHSGEAWNWDVFFFSTAVFCSYMSLIVAGTKIMYPRIEAIRRLEKALKRQSLTRNSGVIIRVRIDQMQLHEKPALLSFLREVYRDNPRMSDEPFWDWHFLENPRVKTNNLPVWLAKDELNDDRIVGQLGAIPVELKVGDKQMRAMWILDLIVHPRFRRQGIAGALVKAAEQFCPLGLGVNTEKQHAPALLRKLEWKVIRKISRYRRFLFPGNAAREFSRIDPLRRIVNSLFRPFRPRHDKSVFRENGALRKIEKFDSAFDELWNETKKSARWKCAVVRDAAFLDWQYSKQPGKQFHIIGYYKKKRLLGYAVLFVRKPGINGAVRKAAITDLCYHPDNPKEIINELLRGALQIALEHQAGTLVTDVIDPLIAQKLWRRFRFIRARDSLQLMVKSSAHQDLLYDAENWFLTRGDSDISIFEHPNL